MGLLGVAPRNGRRKVDNNTYLSSPLHIVGQGEVSLFLHDNRIITWFEDGTTELSTCGWETVTTKDRLNKFGPLSIYQSKYVWYFGDDQLFEGGGTFSAQGERI